MKLSPPSFGFAPLGLPLAWLCFAQAPAVGTPQEGTVQVAPAEPGGLQRVAPERMHGAAAGSGAARAPRDESEELARAFARRFERSEWLARLADADLEQRERSFDLLLKRARVDPIARAFVEELARDPTAGELAWTARMALRQLGRASLPVHFGLPGTEPFGGAKRLQQLMEELLAQSGQGLLFPTNVRVPNAPAAASAGRRVHVEQTSQGARIRITSDVAGESATRSYEGGSLEEILRKRPELERELAGLSLRAEAGARLELRFQLDTALGLAYLGPPASALVAQERSRPIITDRLGVIVQPLDAARRLEHGLVEQGLRVERTYPETYARLLGVGAGCILLELDGAPLSAVADVERAMRARNSGDPLRLVWLDELGQRQEKTWIPGNAR